MPTAIDQLCVSCTAPRPDDAYICLNCISKLRHALWKLTATNAPSSSGERGRSLLDELEATITGQARIRSRNTGLPGASGGELGLPWNEFAATVKEQLHATLVDWVITTAGYHNLTLTTLFPGLADAAEWLTDHVWSIASMEIAGQAVAAILAAVTAVERVIDRPAERRYCGPCHPDCGGQVWGWLDKSVARCADCQAEYDAWERREWLLEKARAYVLTAAEASRAIPALLGRELNVKTIRSWANYPRANQPRLEVAGHTAEGTPLYRLGDIVERAKHSAIRVHEKRQALLRGVESVA